MGVLLELPGELRSELKEPLGPIYQDADELLAVAGEPIVAVGDIVTYHLLEAGYYPSLALVDGKTKRERVREAVREATTGFDERVELESPAGALSASILEVLVAERDGTTLVEVLGEEDLTALPAVLVLPDGASVVYGQPDEGMVLATVTPELREQVRALLDSFVGNHERAYEILGV
ncbi:MAG: DUF359 domain-containing protein [Halobacteriales archaeon]|nr:DUF359 domain-containing protein [Halobacteriales archaeon]